MNQIWRLRIRHLVVAFVLASTPLGAAARAAERVNLAGNFNGWNTGDSAYEMKPAGERLELCRVWDCGRYAFKFAFNGSWDRHLGSAGGDSLTQPGQDITLSIPQTGYYAIWLDVAAKRWGLEPRKPDKPIAIIRVIGADSGAATVVLDASLSAHRLNKILRKVDWELKYSDDFPKVELKQIDGMSQSLRVFAPGKYKIKLTVSDGEMSDTATVECDLACGWQLEMGSGDGNGEQKFEMLPLADGSFGWAFAARRAYSTSARVASIADASFKKVMDREQFSFEANRPYLLRYGVVSTDLAVRNGGFHEFHFSTADFNESPTFVVERIDIVGEFNNWTPGRERMVTLDGGKTYRLILELPDGVYHYKYLVNGSLLIEDPRGDARFRDDAGNSGFLIGDDAADCGVAKSDDVNARGLRHDPDDPSYATRIGANVLTLRMRTLANDAQSVTVRLMDGAKAVDVPMHRESSKFGFDYWVAQVQNASPGVAYDFVIRDGKASIDYGAGGASSDMSQKKPFTARTKGTFETPEWAKTCVWYQIFPERFRNGDKHNDPASTVPWQHDWFMPYKPPTSQPDGSPAEASGYTETGRLYDFIYRRRYGGDLQGIREKLPYLRSLGITAIYLNPIFQAESLHKYDASDYRHIDDAFVVKDSRLKLKGETEDPATWQWSESDKQFLAFLKEAHAMGFKVILDGVFNHVGREFWAFQDVMKNKEKSKYVDWFDIVSFEPFHYKAWDHDDGELPRLKHDDALGLSKPVRDHIFAITKRWMDPNGDGDPSDGIDGWRLDVASDVNEHFWRDWRKLVKSTNPNAYIVAELWEESKKWLKGDCFDAVMNYEFARRVQRFVMNQKKTTKPSEFGKELETMLAWYEPQVNYVLQNLYDSHDTDRIASMCMNPDLEYDRSNRLQDNNPNYNSGEPTQDCYDRVKLAVTFQMTFLGAPMVWYGDEVGMFGADDPTCRKPMLWEDLLPYQDPGEKIHEDVRDHFRRMIAIRNSRAPLQLGSFEILQADDATGVFAFARTLDANSVVVVLNNSDKPQMIGVPVSWPDGSAVIRLDDPKSAEIVEAPAGSPTGRPTIRPVAGFKPEIVIRNGRLAGFTLAPRTGGVFELAPR